MNQGCGSWCLRVSGILTKIHVIPYGITVKTRFGTKPHYPPQFETVPYYSQLKKTKKGKRKKKQKICRSPFSPTPRFSHSLSSCLVSRPPRYRLRERKIKLSPLLIKTSLVGNALCIFGLGNATTYPAQILVCFSTPAVVLHAVNLVHHPGHVS
jgi:hypothetical protein